MNGMEEDEIVPAMVCASIERDLVAAFATIAGLIEFVRKVDKIGSSHDAIMVCEEAGRILKAIATPTVGAGGI